MSDLLLQDQEYNEAIKAAVKDGSYFEDARNWYIFRYIQPICERTILFFVNIISGFITYILILTIFDSLPVKEQVPIRLIAKDNSRYFPVIKPLREDRKSVV